MPDELLVGWPQTQEEDVTILKRLEDRIMRAEPGTVHVVLSDSGYTELMRQRSDYGATDMMGQTVFGAPFSIRRAQEKDFTILPLGIDRSVAVSLTQQEISKDAAGVMLLVASKMTLAQFSDLVQQFVDAHPNEKPMTDMLVDWVQTYGRFE